MKKKFLHGGFFLLVLSFVIPLNPLVVFGNDPSSSEIPSSSESSSIPEDVTVLAVNEAVGFQSTTNYTTNYRAVGSTFFNNTNKFVYLSNGANYTAGSFFTRNKVFLTNSTSAGFSTFFEMTVYGAGGGYADGFTFIVSKDINVLGQAGGAIGYGGINNSIAVLFDNYDNGGQPPMCLSLGVNGSQGNCQYSGYYSGNFKIWIDYNRNLNGGRLEVRMHNANNFVRPTNPNRAWDNISFNQVGNEFYTGFTASTGGFAQVAFLKSWYFSASYAPNGIDPTDAANFITDNIPPSNPVIEPYLIGDEWFFKPDPRFISEPNLTYLYTTGNNQQYTFYNTFTARASFPTTDQTLYLYALDLAGNRSPGAGTYPYYRANFVLNYPGAENQTKFYPGFNASYPVTQDLALWEPVRPGYRFEGWALSPVQTTNLIHQYTFNSNANFFARWSFLPYTVHFETNGGNLIPSIDTNINLGFILPPDPIKANHTFAGWYLDEDFTNPLVMSQFPHITLTLFAKWVVNLHVLSVEHQGIFPSQTLTLPYGEVITSDHIDLDVIEDYAFAGFFLDAEFNQPLGASLTILGDQTIYAKWIDLRPVYAFQDALMTVEQPITTSSTTQQLLAELRQQFNQLTDEQKPFVSSISLTLLEQYEAHLQDLLAVEAVVMMIDSLPRIMRLQDQSLLANALQAYANLTPSQQSLFPIDRSHHLQDLTEQYADLSAASAVEVMIWQLPDALGLAQIAEIEQAIAAFNALVPSEVAMMDPQTILKLTLAQQQLPALIICQTFIDLVDEIGPDITLDDAQRIEAAFSFYQSMSLADRRYVDVQTLQILLTYSKTHQDMVIADPVNTLLSNLPQEATLENEDQFLEAWLTYQSLSSDQQQFVDAANVFKLMAALATIDQLKNVGPGGGSSSQPPIDPPPVNPPVTTSYFPWIVIIVLVTWVGAYLLVKKQPRLVP